MGAPPPERAVAQRFEQYDRPVRDALLELRELVFDVAAQDAQIGPLDETLKWNEPACLSKSGTTLRLSLHKSGKNRIGLYFHCQTDLADRYRELYGDVLEIDGQRAIVLEADGEWPEQALRHAIAMALTYHAKS